MFPQNQIGSKRCKITETLIILAKREKQYISLNILQNSEFLIGKRVVDGHRKLISFCFIVMLYQRHFKEIFKHLQHALFSKRILSLDAFSLGTFPS